MQSDRQKILTKEQVIGWHNLGREQAIIWIEDIETIRCDYRRKYNSLLKKSPYLEFFWSVFSCIQSISWSNLSIIRSISPYSVRMRENADQKSFKYGHFSRSGCLKEKLDISFFKQLSTKQMRKIEKKSTTWLMPAKRSFSIPLRLIAGSLIKWGRKGQVNYSNRIVTNFR